MLATGKRGALCLALLSCVVACAPIGPLPGGRLRGEVTRPPTSWDMLRPYGTLQLETRPNAPYSVNVWGTTLDNEFYVACRPTSRWLPFVRKTPRVRLRIHGVLYELRAIQSTDPILLDRYFAALLDDYAWSPTDEDRAEAVLLKLVRP